MIVGLPPATPVRIPDEEPMVARAVLPLVQVPPVVASVSVSVDAGQTVPVPPIAARGTSLRS